MVRLLSRVLVDGVLRAVLDRPAHRVLDRDLGALGAGGQRLGERGIGAAGKSTGSISRIPCPRRKTSRTGTGSPAHSTRSVALSPACSTPTTVNAASGLALVQAFSTARRTRSAPESRPNPSAVNSWCRRRTARRSAMGRAATVAGEGVARGRPSVGQGRQRPSRGNREPGWKSLNTLPTCADPVHHGPSAGAAHREDGMSTSSTFTATDGDAYERVMGRWSRRLAELFLDFAGEIGGDCLDLGCGTGHLAAAILRRAPDARVTGLDFSPAYVAHARARTDIAGAGFEVGDACDLRFADRSFSTGCSRC